MVASSQSFKSNYISFVFISITIVSHRMNFAWTFLFRDKFLFGVFHLYVRSEKRRDSSSGNAQTRQTTNKKNSIARKLCVWCLFWLNRGKKKCGFNKGIESNQNGFWEFSVLIWYLVSVCLGHAFVCGLALKVIAFFSLLLFVLISKWIFGFSFVSPDTTDKYHLLYGFPYPQQRRREMEKM